MFESKSGNYQALSQAGAFTLIELLIVIAIIGLLSAISILALNRSRGQARLARVRSDISQFIRAVAIAQGESGLTLGQMTGSYCSRCDSACGVWPPGSNDLRNVPNDNSCYDRWITSLANLEIALGGVAIGADKIQRDPWGSPYLLDENECEGGAGTSADSICSAGPGGIWAGGDDICFVIPKLNKCP
ncbi:MAG: prepilin-type N-terminal cleavage/methylation domain-containing protein [Patescibacteria group bacterium]